MHDYHRLRVWKASRVLAKRVYGLAKQLPPSERYGLTAQIRRSSVSIAANIAEGAARGSEGDFRRFLRIASGSASELETELLIAGDVGLLDAISTGPVLDELNHIRRMLINLERSHRDGSRT